MNIFTFIMRINKKYSAYNDTSEIHFLNQLLFILKKVDMHGMFEYLVKELYCWHHNDTSNIHFDMDTTSS